VEDPAYLELLDLVEDFGVGGVLFFQGDPLAQANMTNDLQRRSALPLLISQDMEWGAGMRIAGSTTFPRAMAVGASRDTALAAAIGTVTAREARALGVHQIYAPVADVNNNPNNPIINVRSFGERPDLVADMVTAFADGARRGGVIATVKHFPGHGDTATDSHADLPVLPYDRARLDTLELIPFRAAIAAGVQSVMTAHLAFPRLTSDWTTPSSLSPALTRDLLRDDLGFQGLVVTDGLDMRGVTKHFAPGEAAVRALQAGADILLLSSDPYVARDAILRAVADSTLTEARIDASVRRVLRAKAWAGLDHARQVDLDAARHVVAHPRHRALSHAVARRALTLLGDTANVVPLRAPGRVAVVTLSDSDDPDVGRSFRGSLRPYLADAVPTTHLLDQRSDADDYRATLEDAAAHDLILVPTYLRVRSWSGTIGLPDAQRAFLDDLVATGTPVVLLSFGNPYLAQNLTTPPAAYLVAYGDDDALQETAAQALFGASPVQGALPVTIPATYGYGDGLMLPQTRWRHGLPEEAGMDSAALHQIDSLMHAAITDRAFPGAAVAVGRGETVVKLEGYGHFTYDGIQAVTPQSVFDLASMTKVVATTTAAMLLYEDDRLALDAPVARYLPAFAQNGKDEVTIRHLLTHTSGLPAYRPFHREGVTTREGVIDHIMGVGLDFAPGSQMQYSDFGMITMALVIEAITGQDFAAYAEEHIFDPLGMDDTGFRAVGTPDTTVVPTEVDETFRERLIQGEVHDETAWILGGVAGHAGLFSTAEDLATFAYMLVNDGRIHGEAFLQPETIRQFTTRVAPDAHSRALGWDTKSMEGYSSAGQHFGPRSFGHTGFTGTSLWIDPDDDLFVLLLTNRVYPTRENTKHRAVRARLADLAHQAIVGAPGELLLDQ
jgi:beta-glucosidase-like glycosyl hydrolase/CubicO group peptidase (beta-lactamase class C family)